MLLYIHIPFCDSKCHYCAFNSYTDKFPYRQAYMTALLTQLDADFERFNVHPKSIETLFIGGGTPSTVAPELYAPLFERLTPFLSDDAEITTEANPNSATKAWLQGMRSLGVNRVSFGVQSFDTVKLRTLNRAHSPLQAIEAIHTAKEIGFAHLSLDLIYNVSGDTQALLESDITTALHLPIDHLSAYELTIEQNTPFAATPEIRQDNDALAFFVAETLARHGFEHYEISNFGTYRCRHNLGYWKLKPYIGLGAGAVGYFSAPNKCYRYYPYRDIDAYIADPIYRTIEHIDEEARRTERIFLGLRSIVGVEREVLTDPMRRRADLLVAENKLRFQNGRYYNDDFFIADEIALFVLD